MTAVKHRKHGIGTIAGAGVIGLAVTALCAISAQGQAKAVASKGVELLRQGKFKEAVAQLGEELKKDPGSKRLGIARVKGLLEVGRWREALADVRTMNAASPTDPELNLLLGDCYFFAFRPADAMRAYARVLDDPRWGEVALAKYGNAAVAAGEEGAALSAIRQARAQGRRVPEASRFLEVDATADPKEKVKLLGPLAEIMPESKTVADALALNEALSKVGRPEIVPPGKYPDKAKVKEIYREPCVRGRLDGRRKVWLAFDTGGETMLLNSDLARKMKLPKLADATYSGWGYQGPRKSESVLVKNLEVAGLMLKNTFAVVNHRDTEFRSNKAGYIGLRPFRDNVVYYDRRHGIFQLWPAGTPVSKITSEKGITLPIVWAGDVPIVPVGLMGGGPYPFMLDTGAVFTLISSKYAPRIDIRVNTGKFGKLYGLGLSGAFTSDIAEKVTISVGEHVYHRRYAFVTNLPQNFPLPIYGTLGRDILNQYKMILDCPNNTLTLLPYDKWLKEDLKKGE